MISDPLWIIGAVLVGFVLVVKVFEWLDLLAYLAAILLAFSIWFCLPNPYLSFPIVFLIIGSILSKIFKTDDAGGRSVSQVIANGGPAVLLCWLYFYDQREIFMVLFVLSFAVANSDTLSSVVGSYIKGKTYDISTLSKVEPGISGGISLEGTLFGIIGASLIGGLDYLFFEEFGRALSISIWGSIGMIIDSVLGSTIQAKYNSGGQIFEKGIKSQLSRGFHVVSNDVVNFMSISITCLIYYLYEVV